MEAKNVFLIWFVIDEAVINNVTAKDDSASSLNTNHGNTMLSSISIPCVKRRKKNRN